MTLKHCWIDGGFLLIAFVGMLLPLWFRNRPIQGEATKGVGVRLIQLIAVIILIPTVAILALEGVLSGEGTGTIIGAIVGYALGGITAPIPEHKA